jgi:hypothetical protein
MTPRLLMLSLVDTVAPGRSNSGRALSYAARLLFAGLQPWSRALYSHP